MPYVDIHILKQKNTEGGDLYSRRKELELNLLVNSTWSLSNTLKLRDRSGKKLWQKMGEFEEAIRDVSLLDPKDPENRQRIEEGIDKLEELGDFLGAPGPNGDNIYTYLSEFADEYGKESDFENFQNGLKHLNEVLELGLDLKGLADGKVIQSTPKQRDERAKRIEDRTKRREIDERIEKEIAAQKKSEALKRRQLKKQQDEAQRKKFEEEEKKRREAEEKQLAEAKRLEEERKKTEKQKAEEKEAARQKELKRQSHMRETIGLAMEVYQDPAQPIENRKANMAMAIAMTHELTLIGRSGEIPIDEGRVNREMKQIFNCSEFTIAEATGKFEELAAMNPGQLSTKITAREQEITPFHPEGTQESFQTCTRLYNQFDATWRVKKNSQAFIDARDAMKKLSELGRPATAAENYLASEKVKAYVGKNIRAAKSETGRKRMALALAFLKKTMTKEAFSAYCLTLNLQRGVKTALGSDRKLTADSTNPRAIIPEEIGSVDEVYDNLKEKIGALARKEGEPEKPAARDLARMTALSRIRAAAGPNGGSMIVDKKVLEEETEKVLSNPGFQTSYKNDGAEELINKAWYGNVKTLDGYKRPAEVPGAKKEGPAAGV